MSENINQEILVEIRRFKTFFRRMCYLMMLVIVLVCIPSFIQGWDAGAPSWDNVRTLMKRQNFPAALSMAQSLVAAQPHYDYGHDYLAYVYLAMGDVTNAERQFRKTCELFPSREHERELAAIEERMTDGKGFKLPVTLPNTALEPTPHSRH